MLPLEVPSPPVSYSKPGIRPPLTVVYNPKAFIPHAASLRQPCGHCAIFPTAASRRSLGRISVPNVAGHPLRPATRRRLGGPLPHQQADTPRAPPPARPCGRFHLGAMRPRRITRHYPAVGPAIPHRRTSCSRVTHPSATNLELPPSPYDLHVLGTPLAFVLSQDQTLHREFDLLCPNDLGRPNHNHRSNPSRRASDRPPLHNGTALLNVPHRSIIKEQKKVRPQERKPA